MRYYKITNDNNEIISLEERPIKSADAGMIEITHEEFISLRTDFEKKWVQEQAAKESAGQSYIEQLERENAALLYQVLTGEEYADI